MTERYDDSNSLAQRLDEILPPDQFDAPTHDHDSLLDAALLIANAPQPTPMSAEARMRIRAQVLNVPVAQPAPRVIRFPLQPLLRWGMIASLVLVLLTAGMSPTVLASAPGDVLYPLKQTVEQVEIALAASPQSRAFVHLTHAERRAEESLALLERGQLAADLMTMSLDEMAAAALLTRDEATISARTQVQLEARAVQVNTLLTAVLTLAEQSDEIPQADVDDLANRIRATQESSDVLLPATPEATTEPDINEQQVEATPEADVIPANIVLEGPVQAINDNVITIFDLDIQVEADDPILGDIRIGDKVQVEGHTEEIDGAFIIVAIHIMIVEIEIIIPDAPANPPPASGSSSDCGKSGKGCKQSKKKS